MDEELVRSLRRSWGELQAEDLPSSPLPPPSAVAAKRGPARKKINHQSVLCRSSGGMYFHTHPEREKHGSLKINGSKFWAKHCWRKYVHGKLWNNLPTTLVKAHEKFHLIEFTLVSSSHVMNESFDDLLH